MGGLAAISDGDISQKISFIFKIYDADGDGGVTKEELGALLKSYFGGKAILSTQAVECYDLEDVDFDAEEEAMGQQQQGFDSQGKYDVIGNVDANVQEFVAKVFEADTDGNGILSHDEFQNWLQ